LAVPLQGADVERLFVSQRHNRCYRLAQDEADCGHTLILSAQNSFIFRGFACASPLAFFLMKRRCVEFGS
jgi:hypothetical protein